MSLQPGEFTSIVEPVERDRRWQAPGASYQPVSGKSNPNQNILSNQTSSRTWTFFVNVLPPAETTTVYPPTSAGSVPPNVGYAGWAS